MYKTILFFFLGSFVSQLSFAEAGGRLQKAENFYDAGDYKEAAELYEDFLKEKGLSGNVLFNLGNTYFRLGMTGKAVASYLAAKRLLPRDPDVKKNLNYARSFAKDKLSTEKSFSIFSVLTAWAKNFTVEELRFAGLVLWIFFVLVLLSSYLMKTLSSFKPLFLFLALASASFVFFFSGSSSFQREWGAVTNSLVSVRSGPGSSNTVLFELHEGAPLLWQDEKEGWTKVELSDGKKGWLESTKASFY